MFFAHTRSGIDQSQWHELREHLEETAKLAEGFAASYAEGWGYQAGLWHDLGKYQARFQRRLHATQEGGYADEGVEHAIVGAVHAYGWDKELGAALALCIAAHHGGLKHWPDLKGRLEKDEVRGWHKDALAATPPTEVTQAPQLAIPVARGKSKREFAMWLRFLFSALVDADSLQTEAWDAGHGREAVPMELESLREKLDRFLDEKSERAEKTRVNQLRREVLEECRSQAGLPAGHFTLTVPTGGGKTLSGLTFALHHALVHGKRRIITVLPYTTILEQTVNAYKEGLQTGDVIEHHSNIDVEKESLMNRQATENWDAPIVVTTSVQFLESLYANHKRRCRKLHNIAESVVILDEVQTFPVGFLKPIQAALSVLVKNFGVTVIHCTATQPQLAHDSSAREIIRAPEEKFRAVEGRYRTVWPVGFGTKEAERWDMEELRERVAGESDSVMVIVHRRKEAEELARAWGDDVIHLSGRMCALHRTSVIEEMKRRLERKDHVKLVATQLVEAGVDIDFPVVYRAAAGLDTLAQAAGRCNRAGTLGREGRFVVFLAASKPPAKALETALEEAELFVKKHGAVRLDVPTLFPEYFRALARHQNTDKSQVLQSEEQLNFPLSAERFELIQEAGEPVIAPYGEAWREKVAAIRVVGPKRGLMRGLQRNVVNLYKREEIEVLYANGDIELVHPKINLWVMRTQGEMRYDARRFGFAWQGIEVEAPLLIA